MPCRPRRAAARNSSSVSFVQVVFAALAGVRGIVGLSTLYITGRGDRRTRCVRVGFLGCDAALLFTKWSKGQELRANKLPLACLLIFVHHSRYRIRQPVTGQVGQVGQVSESVNNPSVKGAPP